MNDKNIFLTVIITIAVSLFLAFFISPNSIIFDNTLFEQEIVLSKTIDVEKEIIFNVFTNFEKYPEIITNNYLSWEQISISQPEFVMAKETVTFQGINHELHTQHVVIPYESHFIEIISGDAKGSTITMIFDDLNNGTKLDVKIDLKLEGLFTPLKLIPKNNLEHAANTVLDQFISYAKYHNE